MDKEKKQIYLLVGLGVVILGILVYFNWFRFVPKPSAAIALPPSLPQLVFDTGQREDLFGREDFQSLQEYVELVNQWNYGELGNTQPFKSFSVGVIE